MLNVTVSSGDITAVPSDCLITAINSGGLWIGGIDGAIQRSAGNMFHDQAAARMPLAEGDVIYAPALSEHRGRFGSVIFVVDELQRPLHQVVLAGLQEADLQKLSVVTLPALRTGAMAGRYEEHEAALDETVGAIKQFMAVGSIHVQKIKVVVFNDYVSAMYLAESLRVPSTPA